MLFYLRNVRDDLFDPQCLAVLSQPEIKQEKKQLALESLGYNFNEIDDSRKETEKQVNVIIHVFNHKNIIFLQTKLVRQYQDPDEPLQILFRFHSYYGLVCLYSLHSFNALHLIFSFFTCSISLFPLSVTQQ